MIKELKAFWQPEAEAWLRPSGSVPEAEGGAEVPRRLTCQEPPRRTRELQSPLA